MSDCPFCRIIGCEDRKFIYSTEKFVAFFDAYPVNEGHTLLVPRRHLADISALNCAELQEIPAACLDLREKLYDRFAADGINIGINEGAAAGQTINHLHIHLIPRYQGDIEDPTGGVRGVIPSRQKY
ncbi:MAG: HIT family protein [bacterium]